MAEMEVKHTLVPSRNKLQEYITAGKVSEGTLAIDATGHMYLVDKTKAIRDIANDSHVFENMDDLTEAIESGRVSAGDTVTVKNEYGVYEQYVLQTDDDGDSLEPVPSDSSKSTLFWEELND